MPYEISQRAKDGVGVLSIHGKMTLGIGDNAIHGGIKDLLAQGHKKIVVDLELATAIDSSGVGELVSSTVSALKAGSVIVFAGLSPRVLRILEMTGLLKCIVHYPTFEAALNQVRDMTFQAFLERQRVWE